MICLDPSLGAVTSTHKENQESAGEEEGMIGKQLIDATTVRGQIYARIKNNNNSLEKDRI